MLFKVPNPGSDNNSSPGTSIVLKVIKLGQADHSFSLPSKTETNKGMTIEGIHFNKGASKTLR